MKKYLVIVFLLISVAFGIDTVYYRSNLYVDLHPDEEIACLSKTDENSVYIKTGDNFERIEIKGVDMGSGEPGEWSTDFSLDKETCLRWFKQIQEMGANTVRVYTIQSDDFYEALYEYNSENEEPLYLLQGVWVDEYDQFSHVDGWSYSFSERFLSDSKKVVDVIHGRRKIAEAESSNAASGRFTYDVSPWVLGYIIGVEWEPDVTAYTNDKYKDDPEHNTFKGKYLKTSEDASAFEAMLAYVGDGMISYETGKYKTQRILAFSNWPTTDPFEYPEDIQDELQKTVSIDVEHIIKTTAFQAGQFASYHVYPYYPSYSNYMDDWGVYGIDNKLDYLQGDGLHTYQAYLKGLVNHHTSMPVVISEFGVPASRGMASCDSTTGRNQGNITEQEQGEYLVECYNDIVDSGCAGCCLFSWQDEWFKRTWNSFHAVDHKRNPYWSDYQTNEQNFGVLAFDPGEEETICYPDGSIEEWSDEDIVSSENGYKLSCKYDERYVYLMAECDGNIKDHKLYIPIDTTQKSGSNYCEGEKLNFNRGADFLIMINGEEDSHMYVQERYDASRSTYSLKMYGFNTYLKSNIPDRNSPVFTRIMLPLQEPAKLVIGEGNAPMAQYETGKLTCGNANPDAENYNSITDFAYSNEGNAVEIRIPWQMLNFADPSKMEIHDDYYENHGVAYQTINKLYAGIGSDENNTETGNGERISLESKDLEGWGMNPTSHERLKQSYYAMQKAWTSERTKNITETTVNVTMETEVPVLMYHLFTSYDQNNGDESSVSTYSIWDKEFENDLIYLKENGYTTITCEQLRKARNGEGELPDKPIILSIDDGRYEVYSIAYPLLKKYGMTASLSLICDYINTESKESGNNRSYMFCTWSEISEMAASGCVEMVSHSYIYHTDEEAVTKSGATFDDFDDNTALLAAMNDYIMVQTFMARRATTTTKVLSYPYSVRNSKSDRIWIEAGYRMFLCGDAYTIEDDWQSQFVSKRCTQETVYLVPRTPRLHGESIAYYLNLHEQALSNVLGKADDGTTS